MSRSLILDHVALRVIDRDDALRFLTLLGYKPADSFDLVLEDGSNAGSYALRHDTNPEVFITSGPEDSLIWRWVQKHGGTGAVHHLAYAVADVATTMMDWERLGIEFQSSEPLVCDCETPLTQVFTRPDPSTGLIYELITRNNHPGFCKTTISRLMDSGPA